MHEHAHSKGPRREGDARDVVAQAVEAASIDGLIAKQRREARVRAERGIKHNRGHGHERGETGREEAATSLGKGGTQKRDAPREPYA